MEPPHVGCHEVYGKRTRTVLPFQTMVLGIYPVHAFQTWPGLVFIGAMALRVSTMHGDQSASS